MPTIFSRPPDDVSVIGEGSHQLMLDEKELELVAALIYQTRLGQRTPYSVAAYTLISKISDVYGDDFLDDSAKAVDLQVTIEDDTGSVVLSTKSGNYYPTLEV